MRWARQAAHRRHLRLHRASGACAAGKAARVGLHQRQARSHPGAAARPGDRLFRHAGRHRAGADQGRRRGLDQQPPLGRRHPGLRAAPGRDGRRRDEGAGLRGAVAGAHRCGAPARRCLAAAAPRVLRGMGRARRSAPSAGSANWWASPAATTSSRSARPQAWGASASSPTRSEVVRAAPDIIIGSWCGKKFRAEKVRARDGWADVPAVRDGELHEIKSPIILQPGPAALDRRAAMRCTPSWPAGPHGAGRPEAQAAATNTPNQLLRIGPVLHVAKAGVGPAATQSQRDVHLYEFSVWMRSPASKCRSPPGQRTVRLRRACRCISMREAASSNSATWRQSRTSKSAPSSAVQVLQQVQVEGRGDAQLVVVGRLRAPRGA